jgi:hypothetical protein
LRHWNLLREAWKEYPPVGWLVASYLGYEAPSAKQAKAIDNTRRMFETLRANPRQVEFRECV